MVRADDLPDNWGPVGMDDQRGTLNLITREVRETAAAEVRTGRAVSPATPVRPAPPSVALLRRLWSRCHTSSPPPAGIAAPGPLRGSPIRQSDRACRPAIADPTS